MENFEKVKLFLLGTKRRLCTSCERHITTVQEDEFKTYILPFFWSLETHPQRQKEDLLSTSHNASVVQDMTQLLECTGVERCELTLEWLHIWILRCNRCKERQTDRHGDKFNILNQPFDNSVFHYITHSPTKHVCLKMFGPPSLVNTQALPMCTKMLNIFILLSLLTSGKTYSAHLSALYYSQ